MRPLFLKTLLFLPCLLFAIGCSKPETDAEQPHPARNRSTNTLTIDAEMRERLGIQVSPVQTERFGGVIKRVGWFTSPPATETTVRAPVAGFAVPAQGKEWPQVGSKADAESIGVQINVFLSPQELSQLVIAKEDNDIQLQQALVTMQLSEAQLKLVTTAKDAVAGVRVDQIREAYERSKAAYKEAQDKLPFLIQEPYENGVLVKPVSISSAAVGRILQMHVSRGQFVMAGDPLWTVSNWDTLWVRVPVFVADLPQIATDCPTFFEQNSRDVRLLAEPLNLPSAVQSATRTVDLFYSVTNLDWKLRVGQSVIVELPTSKEVDHLVIPKSALLYDAFGQPACYAAERDSSLFHRKKLELGISRGDSVAVVRGLDADDVVVSVGAEQLAAEETKSELAVEDDD